MKPYYLFFFLILGGLILVISNPNAGPKQAQEEVPMVEKMSKNTFRIKMDIETENDRPVADILWFQQAAELALKKKIPWFNVLEQRISSLAVEGIIQLEPDPMKGEYDANEILSLQLSDEVAE